VPKGTVMGIHTGGGGGYGEPLDRDPARVLKDVNNDFLDLDGAKTIYGVHLRRDENGVLSVDETATENERASRRQSGGQSLNTSKREGDHS
jgi:N-methylhydantoinase B